METHKTHHYSASGETYTVLLRAQDGTGPSNSVRRFYVNWKSVLPEKYRTFKVKGLFNNYESVNNNLDYVFVSVSSLSLRLYDSLKKGRTNIITYAEAMGGITYNQYVAPRIDLHWQTTDYPQSSDCLVEIKKIDGDTLDDVGNWFLWLHFIPIE